MSVAHHVLKSLGCSTLICLLLAGLPFAATAQSAEIDPEASRILQNSTTFLSSLQQFGMVTDNSVEVVLLDGQKIRFDSTSVAAIRRPDRFHAIRVGEFADEEQFGGLKEQEFFYNGKTLTLHDSSSGFYATVPAPDTLEEMLEFARESLDLFAPAGDLVFSNAYEILMEDVTSGFVVGTAVVGGLVCDHLAFSKPGTDFQLWITRGNKPLPMQMVITSRDVLNAPQYTVRLREWDLGSAVPDESFEFTIPDGATAIEFLMPETGDR